MEGTEVVEGMEVDSPAVDSAAEEDTPAETVDTVRVDVHIAVVLDIHRQDKHWVHRLQEQEPHQPVLYLDLTDIDRQDSHTRNH